MGETKNMNTTLEVRWFLPPIKSGRPSIFDGNFPPEARTDWYARSHRGCGIKLREGNLDIKLLDLDLGTRAFGGCRGRLQRWRKWIYDGSSTSSPPQEILLKGGWTPVEKKRSLVVFAESAEGMIQVSDWPETGCQFEWTDVVVNRQHWLTVGFESFGDAKVLEPALFETARLVLPEILDSSLQRELGERTSHSYPEML
jgi:hypothetical protein